MQYRLHVARNATNLSTFGIRSDMAKTTVSLFLMLIMATAPLLPAFAGCMERYASVSESVDMNQTCHKATAENSDVCHTLHAKVSCLSGSICAHFIGLETEASYPLFHPSNARHYPPRVLDAIPGIAFAPEIKPPIVS